ncbi:hypothetical protein HR15_02700 [Porphyromonas gulae]|uniref:Helix-turn-helix domain-containing protein n=2 Tax=Porphyromonas gulae TaxID=111105 RepID=A0A0A2FJY8_9PORP|nr:hypothetical protein HR15_02700 [Porphyromonas gulae]
MSSNLELTKRCKWCKLSFIAKKMSTEYCSQRCANLAYKARKREERIGNFTREQECGLSEPISTTLEHKPFLSTTEAAKLLGVSKASIYRYLELGLLSAMQFPGKTILSRANLDKTFDNPKPYVKRMARERKPITDFYTTNEILNLYGVSYKHLYDINKKKQRFPTTMSRGRTLWSKKHVDAYFAKRSPDPNIEEWISVEELIDRYDVPKQTIYDIAYEYQIAKKKQGVKSLYDKQAIVRAFESRSIGDDKDLYYTAHEAMEKYGLSYNQISKIISRYKLPKKKVGRHVWVLKTALDDHMSPPSIPS